MKPKKTYEVTGTLEPDVTGTYEDAGEYNDERYYELAGNGWYIWTDGFDNWFISTALGVKAGAWWVPADPDLEGDYNPAGTAIGIATVTEI